MCRLFALHAGRYDVEADFWLLEAPTSIAAQSEVNVDGFGIAALSAEAALALIRNPLQAAGDRIYGAVARHAEACQFLVHLRYADTGGVSLPNTHPFLQDGGWTPIRTGRTLAWANSSTSVPSSSSTARRS